VTAENVLFYPVKASSRVVIASEAKQSSVERQRGQAMDCFVASLLAMTARPAQRASVDWTLA
jgi:hypothetical protein